MWGGGAVGYESRTSNRASRAYHLVSQAGMRVLCGGCGAGFGPQILTLALKG